jgi:hypothetical protein
MNKASFSLALRIAQLLNDHSKNELRDAIEVLHKHGYEGELLTYLASRRPAEQRIIRAPSMSKVKPAEEITSRAVLRLKGTDPEKFRVLSEFDSMVRRGQLLPTHEDLRKFGERVSKTFEPKKARKETIGALMTVLATRTIKDIEELMEFSASFGVSGNTDEFQRLARFLIKGKEEVQGDASSVKESTELRTEEDPKKARS